MSETRTQNIPALLRKISDPPKKLYVRGTLPPEDSITVCIVGSRKYSAYGKEVCEKLVASLAPYKVSIVSGLALGIDSIAHESALRHKMHTIAVPGSGLDPSVLYPASHRRLAENILASGGALLSEFEPTFRATTWSFPQRNRIMAGLSKIVIVVEAEKKSGTLITARLAMEYNRDVAAVPGPIFSKNSEGPHHLIKNGAIPITSPNDIIEVLNLEKQERQENSNIYLSHDEQRIVLLLEQEPLTRNEIVENLDLSTTECSVLLTKLELKGMVKESFGKLHIDLQR